MADVAAFRGVRYPAAPGSDISGALCPPYDVISPAQQQALLQQDPQNVVRLELPLSEPGDSGDARYGRAAETYRAWLNGGTLQRDAEPALYVYGQDFRLPDGTALRRLGVIAALGLEQYGSGKVLPHEETFPKHKEDRFRLLSTAQAQFSPIFGLYPGGEGVRAQLEAAATGTPALDATDPEGVRHLLWPVTDSALQETLRSRLEAATVYIADGHHRYETALRHQAERRAEMPDAPPSWFDRVMIYLVDIDDPGLVCLPTHRLVRGIGVPQLPALRERLERYFTVEETAPDAPLAHHQLGLLLPPAQRAWRLTLREPEVMAEVAPSRSAAWRDLDVSILHGLVLGRVLPLDDGSEIAYTRDFGEAIGGVVGGEYQLAFLMPSPTVDEVRAVSAAGEKMPHKSTFFWPKVITGLVIYDAHSLG